METRPDHHCPGCGKRRTFFARYPWHFCSDCLERAVDGEGRALLFGNISLSGGLRWSYADAPEADDRSALHVLCLIDGREVVISEARFGGVVAEPANSATLPALASDRHTADLRDGAGLATARRRLRGHAPFAATSPGS